MFNPQPKPQFHTYPLRTGQLSKLTEQMSQLNHQIFQNRKEIQQINKKLKNQQYQNAYVQRLHQKIRILELKKQELQYINKMHQYHQQVQDREKKLHKSIHQNLANEYKLQIQDHMRRKSQEKQMERQRDRQQLDQNMRRVEAIQAQKEKKKQQTELKHAQENKLIQHNLNTTKLQNRQNQKKYYLQSLQRTQPTDKQLAFQQYYANNQLRSQQLQKVYKTATEPQNLSKLNQTIQIEQKNQEEYLQNLQKKAQQKQQQIASNQDSLKHYLQNQIQSNNIKKYHQSSSKLLEDLHRQNNLIDNQRYEKQERQKTRLSQYLYSTELARQYNRQLEIQKQNSLRNKQHTYINQSTDAIVSRKEINSPESPKSGIFLGNQKNRNPPHNPLTNPIPFSIGITNPYVLKEYQNRRNSSSFRGSNLAQIGDQSMRN